MKTFRIKAVILCLILILVAFASKFYIFIFQNFVRSYAADFLAVIIVILIIKLIFIRLKPLNTSIIALSIAISIEFIQLINRNNIIPINNRFLEVTIGRSFDLVDIIVYVLAAISGFIILKLLKSF